MDTPPVAVPPVPVIEIAQSLVRRNDPPDVRGDPTLIRQLVGWEAGIKLEQTLIDLLATT